MRRLEESLVDLFLGIDRDVAAHRRGVVPELKRLTVPVNSTIRQKCQSIFVGTQILCKLPEPTLISVVLWLDFEAKVTGQLLIMFKKMTYVIEVLVELHRPLREVSTWIGPRKCSDIPPRAYHGEIAVSINPGPLQDRSNGTTHKALT
jgi:hypothetical protein